MSFAPSQADREWLVSQLAFQPGAPATQKEDLLDSSFTKDNLIQALMHAVKQGHKLLVTCVNRDHGDDSSYGPHGHTGGYSIDVAMQDGDDADAAKFVNDSCNDNPKVIKLGLGGMYQHLMPTPAQMGDTEVFEDNSTNHIHFEAGG